MLQSKSEVHVKYNFLNSDDIFLPLCDKQAVQFRGESPRSSGIKQVSLLGNWTVYRRKVKLTIFNPTGVKQVEMQI